MRVDESVESLLQVTTALKCGVRIPDTIVANDPQGIERFRQRGPAVVRVVGQSYLRYGSQELKFLSRRLNLHEPEFSAALRSGPVIVQREVEGKSAEQRTFVVGFTHVKDESQVVEGSQTVR